MDYVEFQEKMDPNHREFLCRMIQVKELPEDLLEQYCRVKKMADRIDAHLSPGVLALIAMIVGSDGFGVGSTLADEKPQEPVDKPLDETVDQVVEETIQPNLSEIIVEEPAEQVVEQPAVSGTTGQAVDKPAPKPAKTGNIWSPGMPVNVLHNDELKSGKIAGIPKLVEGKAQQLTVEFEDGDTITVDEDEVEAE
jgi:hypothetical protein